MSTAVATASPATIRPTPVARRGADRAAARSLLHVFLIVIAAALAVPDRLRAAQQLPRPTHYTAAHGYFSFGGFTFDNYTEAWERADFTQHFLNTIYITVPAVLLTLFLASCVAFVLARFSFKFNLTLLGLFTGRQPAAASRRCSSRCTGCSARSRCRPCMSDSGTLLNSFWALILVNTAFQTGFCAFVLSNYMKTLPQELYEAAAGRRRPRAAAVLAAHAAAVPAAAGRAGDPRGHLDLQRVLLGHGAAAAAATSSRSPAR